MPPVEVAGKSWAAKQDYHISVVVCIVPGRPVQVLWICLHFGIEGQAQQCFLVGPQVLALLASFVVAPRARAL